MTKETFTRDQVIQIMEDLRLYHYDWENKTWSTGGNMASAMIKESTETLLRRLEWDMK